METPSYFTKKNVVFFLLLACLILYADVLINHPQMFHLAPLRTTLIFCDVGQGDGAYIRTRAQTDILIDTGPDDKILRCLGRYMPFYDRTIDFVFISHPQADHIGGLRALANAYSIGTVFMNDTPDETPQVRSINDLLKYKKIDKTALHQGNKISIEKNVAIFVLWPPKGLSVTDPNAQSQILHFQDGKFDALFTGDSDGSSLDRVLKRFSCVKSNITSYCFKWSIDLLKIPHHGSKNGLNPQFLKAISPTYSVISVGINNRYGHPSPEVLSMLKNGQYHYIDTASQGDVAFEIGNKDWRRINTKH